MRAVSKLIGSGGYLSRADDFIYSGESMAGVGALSSGEQVYLVPQHIDYCRDSQYIFPLLGNLVDDLAERAVLTALESLT